MKQFLFKCRVVPMKMFKKLTLLMICAILWLHETQAHDKSNKFLKEFITGHIHDFPEAALELPPKVEDTESSNETNKEEDTFADGRNLYKSLRHCEIEVTQRIKGVCESIRPIGTACVSGDYMDVFNTDCMSY